MSTSVTGGTMAASKPNTLVMHENGLLSIRIKGDWRRNIRQVTGVEYLALPREMREKILITEFNSGYSLIEGHEPIVTRAL